MLEQVQQEVADIVAATAETRDDPWDQFVAGCQALLTASTDPRLQRIMLVDGPAVLGWAEWRALDEANSARHLTEALDALVASGIIPPQPVEPLTRLLSGAMNEAALWLATAEGSRHTTETMAALTRLLAALRAGHAPGADGPRRAENPAVGRGRPVPPGR